MESGKAPLGFLLILLLVFGGAAGAGYLAFSDTKTGIPAIDGGIDKLQGLLPQSDNTNQASKPAMEDGHDHGEDHDHNHDHNADHSGNDDNVPGKKGQIYDKPVNPVLGVRSVGDPAAPIKVREFFSLTCNHCATFHGGTYQQLKQKYINTGKVQFIFEEFPLNGPALYGSMIARSLPESRYESFISLLLKTQQEWAFSGDFKSALKQNAALAGMSEEQFEAAFNDKELQKAIATNIQESSNIWQISSTPSFVINDGERILSGVRSLEDFEKVMSHLTGENFGTVIVPTTAPALELAPTPTPNASAPASAPVVPVAPTLERNGDALINVQEIPEGLTIETPEITVPEIEVPEVDMPEIEKPAALESTTIDINDLFEP